LAIGPNDDLYIADETNLRIRKVSAQTKTITTAAGAGIGGFSGNNQPALSALVVPRGIAFDSLGNLLIAQSQRNIISRLTAISGIVSNIAGNTQYAFSGDGGPAISAAMRLLWAVALDAAGNIYIANTRNNRIRAIKGPLP